MAHPEQSDAGTTRPSRRLVLCFDGTDNEFTAGETDTNIVKIYELLNRESLTQYHYYQPGVGTYVPNKLNNSKAGFRDKITKLQDSGFGTYFVDHVISGYRFLMRYFSRGDKIYIFGFSRGAYTARFLANMITRIGLLSMGNEEMIFFAWEAFSDFQTNRNSTEADKTEALMNQFRSTFCRTGEAAGEPVQVHFLGLFDCVNSVAAFLSAKDMPMPMPHEENRINLPAKYVRHALSIHERRAMFQPVLFDPDPKKEAARQADGTTALVERWFSGNHGDVGGGWNSYPVRDGEDSYLLSDIPLRWMIEQVKQVDEASKLHGDDNILEWRGPFPPVKALVAGQWRTVRSGNWEAVYAHAQSQIDSWALKHDLSEDQKKRALEKARKSIHDMLQHRTMGPDAVKFSSWFSFAFWWLLEGIGLPRWVGIPASQDRSRKLYKTTYALNRGRPRDIPTEACKHWSVPKLRACQVNGEAALGWMKYAMDEKIIWTDAEPKS